MNPPAPGDSSAAHPARRAIVWGGILCGTLDITFAMVMSASKGGNPLKVFQAIASALVGGASFQAGWLTIVMGFLMHFGVAFTITAIFWGLSRKYPLLGRQAVPAGLIYGLAVFVVMNWVVIPLSGFIRMIYLDGVEIHYFSPLHWPGFVAHLFCVGLPIGLAVHRVTRTEPSTVRASASPG